MSSERPPELKTDDVVTNAKEKTSGTSFAALASWATFVIVGGIGAVMIIWGIIGLIGEEGTGAAEGYAIAYGSMVFVFGAIITSLIFVFLKILTLPFRTNSPAQKKAVGLGIEKDHPQRSKFWSKSWEERIAISWPYLTGVGLGMGLAWLGVILVGTDSLHYLIPFSIVATGFIIELVLRKLGRKHWG